MADFVSWSPRPHLPEADTKRTDMTDLNRIIRKKELPKFTGLQRSAIDDLIRVGNFPKPIPLGKRSVGWLESEILDWQRARIAERDGQRHQHDLNSADTASMRRAHTTTEVIKG
jgi:prophage regulatory protein